MTVINLPFVKPLVVATEVKQFEQDMPIGQLLERDFPQDADIEVETGLLVLSEKDAHVLSQFFYAFGLRLPPMADGVLTHQLWNQLQFKIGRIVRVELNGGDSQKLCSKFNDDELEYGRMVAAKNVAAARRLARKIFGGTKFVSFFA